jgi:hypothetical protein
MGERFRHGENAKRNLPMNRAAATTLVIPSEVEESRNATLKVTSRDPSTSLGMTAVANRSIRD